ncbi:ABC transporter ATP-binding protein [Desulfocurvus sp. DL9XJH121]
MASITMTNIRKSFGNVEVLKGIDLTVRDGEFISLLGSSGCGKSTLLRILSGLEEQTSGTLEIDGKDMHGVRPKDRSVSMVFQSYALYPHLTVFENMAVPLVMRRLSRLQRLPLAGRFVGDARARRKEIEERVTRLAENLDIAALLDRRPSQLSGGQRQRVALGRAMVREPEVFLMDEPLSNLDTKMRAHMRTELAELHRSLGATFVYVTHDQEEAMTMSDRVALMIDGAILQVAAPRDIYRAPVHRKVAEFIGSPRINILPGQITEPGVMEVCGVRRPAPAGLAGDCFLGIRPSRLTPSKPGPGAWKARVANVEDLGSSFLVHGVLADGTRTISRMDSRAAIPGVGGEVSLRPQPGCALIFDAEGWNHGRRAAACDADAPECMEDDDAPALAV